MLQACKPDNWTVREARAGHLRPHQQAGGLLSLDLSAAFDTLEWCHIAEALQDAAVPEELQMHIMAWHHDIKYHLDIQGRRVEISASIGGSNRDVCVVISYWSFPLSSGPGDRSSLGGSGRDRLRG